MPEVLHEFLRVVPGVDDAVVLPEELIARIARDLTELVVRIGDAAVHVGDRDDRRVIERAFEIRQLPFVGRCHASSVDILAGWPLRHCSSWTTKRWCAGRCVNVSSMRATRAARRGPPRKASPERPAWTLSCSTSSCPTATG